MRAKRYRKYDAPRPGFKRWTGYVNEVLLFDFIKQAHKEKKTLVAALDEAIRLWTYPDKAGK